MLLVLALLAAPGDARKLGRPPAPEELLGRWAGYTEDDLYFVQCELQEQRSGQCAVSWLGSNAKLYAIESWHLDAAQLTFRLTPIDAGAQPLFLRGIAAEQLRLVIGETRTDWRRELKLYRLTELQNALAITAARLDSQAPIER